MFDSLEPDPKPESPEVKILVGAVGAFLAALNTFSAIYLHELVGGRGFILKLSPAAGIVIGSILAVVAFRCIALARQGYRDL